MVYVRVDAGFRQQLTWKNVSRRVVECKTDMKSSCDASQVEGLVWFEVVVWQFRN